MGWKFNPFTGALDQTGSGGGGSSYIDGEVATYNDLPLDGTAALNSAWLVRGSSGVWPFTKPGGVYVRTATGGSSRDADYTYAGIFPDVFSDANFTLYDDSDTSKNAKFQLSGISTGTTRTLTVPDGSGTIQLSLVRSSSSMSSNVSLSAGRARHITYTLLGGSYQVTLPLTGNQSGDVCRLTNSTSSSSGAILTVARGNGSGGTVLITTLEKNQTVTCFNRDGTEIGWTLEGVDTHAHAAADVTSGTFDNARINFAAPSSIGSTTANSGAFTTLSANNGTLTASAPVLDLSQTWNNAAVTFTGLRVNATNTASAAASLIADFQTGGTSRASIRQDGRITCSQVFTSDSLISGLNVQAATSSFFTWSGADMLIARDAADVLAIRRSANPQTFRIYNTNDSSTAAGTNFERGFMRWSSNVLQIGTEAAGTGTARNLELQTGGTTRLTLDTVGTVILQTSGGLTFSGRTGITSPAAGAFRLLGTDGSTFNFLYLGVQSASYPALKRSSTTLQVRLGDDSAYTTIDANHRLQGTAPATSGATGTAGDIRYDADYIYVCTAANTWKRAAIATW